MLWRSSASTVTHDGMNCRLCFTALARPYCARRSGHEQDCARSGLLTYFCSLFSSSQHGDSWQVGGGSALDCPCCEILTFAEICRSPFEKSQIVPVTNVTLCEADMTARRWRTHARQTASQAHAGEGEGVKGRSRRRPVRAAQPLRPSSSPSRMSSRATGRTLCVVSRGHNHAAARSRQACRGQDQQ